jgi:LEA14-like dessication related protein
LLQENCIVAGNCISFGRIALKKGICLLLLLAVLAGCTALVKEPQVTVRDLSAVSLDGGGAGMELLLTVQNANPYEVRLLGYSYDLKVMALPLARGGAREEIRFPAGAATDLRIPVKVSYGDLLEIFKRKPDPERIPYQLMAGLDLDTPLGQLTVPVNRTGTYAVPKQYRPGAILDRLGDFFRMNN